MIEREEYFKNIAEYKLLAKHEVGQNFLIDDEVAENIVSFAELKEGERVLEIGSGAGSLSYFIAQSKAEADLIDIDEGLVTKLEHDFETIDHVKPQLGNAMRWDLSSYHKIIGNLPYYITSGILERVLLNASSCEKAIFMVQKEAYLRLTAGKSSKDYGPLPILIQYRAETKRLLSVPRNSFAPAPHIDSVVFSLTFKDNATVDIAQRLYRLLNGVFLHRRKTIQNNLGSYLKDPAKAASLLESCGIAPNRRPEDIDLAEYLKLLARI